MLMYAASAAAEAATRSGLVQFDWTIIFQVVNTLILFFFLRKLLFKPVTEFMAAREKEIAGQYDEAAAREAEAEKLKNEYIVKIEQSEDEGKRIIRDASSRAEQRASQIIKEAEADIVDLKAKAQSDIEREKVKAVNALKDDIASMAVLAASKVIEKDIDASAHRTLIDATINEVGDSKWQN